MFYTGIGSRETPANILIEMQNIARSLANKGYILRSGGAIGADLSFEYGAWTVEDSEAEIFLPWASFNIEYRYFEPALTEPADWVYPIAEQYHPSWRWLKHGARKLHARNVHQILGTYPNSQSSKFVICWTKGANGGGGTGQAIRIAKDKGIPIFDLADEKVLKDFLKKYDIS